jgi:16S rRNA (cytidine1402-2'-O)-methyltransferase
MALMASGMNGQSFCFNGYLPVEKKELSNIIRQLEQSALKNRVTQIFIETPYRNQRLFESLLTTCRRDTRLCIAQDISGGSEFIKTMEIAKWKAGNYNFGKAPAVFLLSS